MNAKRKRKYHGYHGTREHRTWLAMRGRCLSPDARHKKFYAGITICADWDAFTVFLNDMGKQPEGTTLDRIDGNKGYCKSNCRWATWVEQQNNRKSNHLVTYKGVTKNLTAWAYELGISFRVLQGRILRGWDTNRAFTQRVRKPVCAT